MTCEKCHKVLEIADWPFCPHDRGASFNVQPDSIPGGLLQENGFSTPQRVYSWSELHRKLDAAGLQMAPRHVQGGKLSSWSSVDLEAARALVTRGASPRATDKQVLEPHPDYPITVSDAGWSVKP